MSADGEEEEEVKRKFPAAIAFFFVSLLKIEMWLVFFSSSPHA